MKNLFKTLALVLVATTLATAVPTTLEAATKKTVLTTSSKSCSKISAVAKKTGTYEFKETSKELFEETVLFTRQIYSDIIIENNLEVIV